MCSHSCLGTCVVDQAGLEPRYLSACLCLPSAAIKDVHPLAMTYESYKLCLLQLTVICSSILLVSFLVSGTRSSLRGKKHTLAYELRAPFHDGGEDMAPQQELLLITLCLQSGSRHKQEVGLAYKALRPGIGVHFLQQGWIHLLKAS